MFPVAMEKSSSESEDEDRDVSQQKLQLAGVLDQSSMEGLSTRIFRQLDCTGYCYQMIQYRREHYLSRANLYSMGNKDKTIIVGSKGDGLTKPYESDRDTLHFMNEVLCIEDAASVHLPPAHVTVFTMRNTEAGYCMLELLREGAELDVKITNGLVTFNGKVMLSSQVAGAEFATTSYTLRAVSNTRTGPARTSTLASGLSYDDVTTIQCHCLSILNDFVNRPRTHDWPSSSLRQTISQMTGNLVAAGSDDSETKHLEWRYCFNEIEKLIMSTLNDTQLKLYKLMTIINKDIFKQRGLPLTSFIMKNIIFWIAETHAQSLFLPKTLYHWFCEALMLLKQYVEANKIPCYMIPSRNLLKEKVKESDRPKLIQVITDVIESESAMLFECETIRKYADLTPQELSVLKPKLETLELCDLKCQHICIESRIQGENSITDFRYMELRHRKRQILRSGWPPRIQQQIDECEDKVPVYRMLLK